MMKRNLTVAILLFCTCLIQAAPLRVSLDGHHLMQQNGKPFLYLGDTGWNVLNRLNRDEIANYLENRREKGFTVIQTVIINEFDGFNWKNYYKDPCFTDLTTLTPATTPGNNPAVSEAYDYWDHVDYLVKLAAEKGLMVGLLPSWGEWITPRFNPILFKTAEQGYEYGWFLGNRYKKSNNIIWILGGDRLPDERPEGISIWRAIAEGIADATNGEKGFDRKADYTSTTMTYHCYASSSTFFHLDDWIDFHTYGSYHEKQDLARAWRLAEIDYKLDQPKPTLNSEPAYEDHPINYDPTGRWGFFDDFDVRQIAYWSVFAGAAGHTYGCHPVWQCNDSIRPAYSKATLHNWQEGMDLPGAWQMLHLKNLLLSRPFFERIPDQSIITGEPETGSSHVRACRGISYAFIYIPDAKPVDIKTGVISGSGLKAWWYNPRDGKASFGGTYPNKGILHLTPPGNQGRGNDWILVLDDAQVPFEKPGKVE